MATNSWRQYGGTRKQNQFHNLTIGTLVADKLLLRESYAGKFIIPGSIFVGADVNSIGNIYSYQNTYTSYDNYIGKNLYLNKYLYFGTVNQVLDGDFSRAYMTGDFSANTIGVNIKQPISAFDINGTNNTQTDILSVASSAPTIRNTLGKNINNRGISLTATNSNTQLGFYVDVSLNYNNTPNAQINYTSGGNMYYVSTNNNIQSSNNTILTSSGSTFITSQTLTNITSTQSVSINTKNTNILSTLAISNRGQPTNIYNESTIIYDISNGLYLYDAYENSNAKAGSALTMVATDNSSNTFLRLIAPNNAGLSIAAGTYPNDQTRTIGAIGMTNNSGKYLVNQTVVSGNSSIKYYTTTGFNTYAPRTENYVMDVNGPTHISNGEINKMAEFNFDILKTSFSKTVKPFGISVGSPSPSVFDTNKRLTVYPQYVSYTSDGGLTWNSTRIDTTSDLETTPKIFTNYTYDNNYSIIASSNSFFYYTLNGGVKWWLFAFLDPNFTIVVRNAVSIYIGEFNGNTKRVFIIYTLRNSPQIYMVYFNIDFTTLPTQNNYLIMSFTTLTPNPSITSVNATDGSGNSVYFAGAGINKYNSSTVVSQYLINTSFVYYGITCYSETYVVAVGSNIISYTYDGTNWTNIILSNTAVGSGVILRSVYLFDNNLGMAVGDNGIFLYTNNGAQTWTIVPNSILNSSGYASRINGSYNKLRNVFMNDINTMSVISVKQSYLAQTSNGLSKIYTCYIPNLYNRANNKLLDISGNMEISGDININDGGNLLTNNSTFNLINTNATTVNFATAANNIFIGSILSGKTRLQHDFDVSGNTTLKKNLIIQNDLSLSGSLYVGNKSIMNNDVSMNKNLFVGQDASFTGNLYVQGYLINDMSFEYMATLTVEKTMYCKEHLIVSQDASFNGNVYVGAPNSILTNITSGNTYVYNSDIETLSLGCSVTGQGIQAGSTVVDLSLQGNYAILSKPATSTATNVPLSFINTQIFAVYPDLSLNSRIFVGSDASFSGRLSIKGDVSLNSNLVIHGSQGLMQLNSRELIYNYSSNPNLPEYYTFPLSRFQYIQTLTQNVQDILNNVTAKTGPIGITNLRDFNIDANMVTSDVVSNLESTSIDPTLFGVSDTPIINEEAGYNNTINSRAATTILTFDIGANNLLLAGNVIPSSAGNVYIGTDNLPLKNISVSNQNALNFVSSDSFGNFLTKGTVSFNTTTGLFDISNNGANSSTLVSYGGNVAIGKPRPTTNFDVLGTSIFNGDITQQSGNMYLNNRLFVSSDLSLGNNAYLNKNVIVLGDSTFNSRMFLQGDVSINSNLFVLKDASYNGRVYVGGDTSLNSKVYVGSNINIIGDTSLNNRLNVRGDVSLNSGLYVTNNTVLNGDLSLNGIISVNGVSYFNNNQYLTGSLFVTGSQTLNNDITIKGKTTNFLDVSMNSRLFLSNDASFNSKLSVIGIATFNNDTYLNRNVFISNDLSLNGNLSIGGTKLELAGDASINGDLYVKDKLYVVNDVSINGNTSVNGSLFVNNTTTYNGDVSMNKRLFVANDLSLAGDLLLNKRLIINGDASLNQNINIAGSISNNGDISTNSRLFVSKDTSLNANLSVKGYTYLNNDLSINGDLLTSNAIVRSSVFINKNIVVQSDASFNANLIVGGNTVVNGTTNIIGALSTNNITNTGNIITSSATTTGDVNIGSNLMVNKNTNLNGRLIVGNDVNVNSKLTVASDLSINGRLFVANYLAGSIPIGAIAGGGALSMGSFSNDVNIGKSLFVGGDATLYGNLTIIKDLTLIGHLIVKQYSVNQTITTLSYEIMIAQDLSLNGRFFMTGDASINGRLCMAGDASINGRILVNGDAFISNRLLIGSDVSMNSNLYVARRTIQNGDLSLNSRLFVGRDASINGNLSVVGRIIAQNDAYFSRSIYGVDASCSGNVQVNGYFVTGDASINGRLFVAGDESINGSLLIKTDASINNRLYIGNDVSMNSNLYVGMRTIQNGDLSLNSRLLVGSDVSLNANLFVLGKTIYQNDVSFNKSIYGVDASFSKNIQIVGSLITGDASINNRLYIGNDVSMNSNLYVARRTIQNGDLSLNSRLFVGGDVSINSNLFVFGKTIHQNDAIFNKTIFGVDASFSGNVVLGGNLIIKSRVQTLTLTEALYSTNDFTATSNVFLLGKTKLADTSLNGNFAVTNDISVNGNLAIGSNIIIGGNSKTIGDVSMVSSLDLNGAMIARSNMNVYGIINQYNTTPTDQTTIVNNTSYVTSNASQITLGTSSTQNVYVPGNIGIGTTNPLVPLYINKSSASTGQTSGYYNDNTAATMTAINTSAAYNYSIYALNSIATSDKLIATSSVYFSDERIKTDIQDIDTTAALDYIRCIRPKKYRYIDKIGQGSEATWGFIAQDVKTVVDHCVSISKNFIPNIYDFCHIKNKNTLVFTKNISTLLKVGSLIKAIAKDQTEIILTIQEIVNDKTFIIENTIDNAFLSDGKLFIYGQEIEDFNNLDKNAIFTITTAALKKVDKDLQDTKKRVIDQNARIEILENQMKIITASLL